MAVISYLEYSDRDMKYARDMYTFQNYDPCGRFCQQSVEKRLKYFIERYGTTNDLRILHIHSLPKLYYRVCELIKSEIDKVLRGDLYQLTTYYFDTNYPSEENIELTEEMAREALDIAANVNKWVDTLLAELEEANEK
jgi:HEPN domain-containing protein